MAQHKLQIEYLNVDELTPYENNARKHDDDDVSMIENSIEEFDFNDPIGVWGENNIIVEGHGRLLAAKKAGLTEVPCIRLDHLTDEQRKAYTLAHNKTAENSSWDLDTLADELASIPDIDMSDFGFDELNDEILEDDATYTNAINIPQYEVKGETPELTECYDASKAEQLTIEIENSNLTDEEKKFLKKAAQRHNQFNYRKIAEYYASASIEMQHLMEKSALVIIDYNDAIANGYTKLKNSLEEMRINDE